MPLSQRGERASYGRRKCSIDVIFLSSEDDRDSRVVIVDYIRVFQTFQVLRYSPRVLLLPVLVNESHSRVPTPKFSIKRVNEFLSGFLFNYLANLQLIITVSFKITSPIYKIMGLTHRLMICLDCSCSTLPASFLDRPVLKAWLDPSSRSSPESDANQRTASCDRLYLLNMM